MGKVRLGIPECNGSNIYVSILCMNSSTVPHIFPFKVQAKALDTRAGYHPVVFGFLQEGHGRGALLLATGPAKANYKNPSAAPPPLGGLGRCACVDQASPYFLA